MRRDACEPSTRLQQAADCIGAMQSSQACLLIAAYSGQRTPPPISPSGINMSHLMYGSTAHAVAASASQGAAARIIRCPGTG